jgi:hypothetical protein
MLETWWQSLVELQNVEEISYVRWRLGNDWPAWVLLVLAVGSVLAGLAAYAAEPTVGGRRRWLLASLRTISIVLLVLMLLEPTLSVEYTTKGRSSVLMLVDRSESMSVPDVAGSPEEDPQTHDAVARLAGSRPLGELTRWDLAQTIAADPVHGVPEQFGADHDLEMFTLGEETNLVSDREAPLTALRALNADGASSSIGGAMQAAIDRFSGQNVSALVLISDMAWNAGQDPVALARRLGQRGVPVFPVPVGRASPPDLMVSAVHVRRRVFVDDLVPVKVQVRVAQTLDGAKTTLALELDGVETASRKVTLVAGPQVFELPMRAPSDPGRATLTARLEALPEEVTAANNAMDKPVEFIDEKIKVLYVEGFPRWEFRYLRWVLLRDPRLDVKFLMTEGDPELAKYSEEHLAKFPAEGREEFDFDLVIIGDVASLEFSEQQMQWMRSQVQRRGGAMLMLGGPVHAPQAFAGSPIADLLPVRVEGGSWMEVPDRAQVVPTEEGLISRIAAVGDDEEHTRSLWTQLSPLYELPPVSAKPGATVLLTVPGQSPDETPYPLVAWQRFGTGKAMFVGSEHLWRLRRKVGREHHERFWATAIQFLTVSRLLGGNERITLETDKGQYATGETVRVFADVLDEYLEPVQQPGYEVMIQRVQTDEEALERRTRLSPASGTQGLYRGFFAPQQPGVYQVQATGEDAQAANTVRFEVVDASREMLDPATRLDVAQQVAAVSGGKVVSLSELEKLGQWVDEQQPRYVREATYRLWDQPWLFVLLLLTAGLEWSLRRRRRLV